MKMVVMVDGIHLHSCIFGRLMEFFCKVNSLLQVSIHLVLSQQIMKNIMVQVKFNQVF